MKAIRLITFSFLTAISLLTIFLSFIKSQSVTAQMGNSLSSSESDDSLGETPLERSLEHLAWVMDKCHQTFVVYSDLDNACNHFSYQARLEVVGHTTMSVNYTETVHSGSTAIKNTFDGVSWGGWYFQNGVLLSGDPAPIANWGTYSNAGFDLTGVTQLTFWARGEQGGERVEFFAFGIGRDGDGTPIEPYPDSSPKVTTCGLTTNSEQSCYVTLSNNWQLFTIDLTGVQLDYVIGGFGWVTNNVQNDYQSITFYLDDIQYEGLNRTDEPRFLTSFEVLSTTPSMDFDIVNNNVVFIYDMALALMAFTADGNQERAQLIADAFVYCQTNDRYYGDGRLRNAYMAGDLTTPPGWRPNGREGTCRLPGWTNRETGEWQESGEHVGSGTGNLTWTMIALLNYYEKWGGEEYLNAAITLGDWIDTHTRDERWQGGYLGGYNDAEPAPTLQLYKSTEHNIDLYVAYERLYLITNDQVWRDRALYARGFVEAMWNDVDGHYWTGTFWDAPTIFTDVVPLDGQTWAHHAFGLNERMVRALQYADETFYVASPYTTNLGGTATFEGFDFNRDLDLSWPEGTGQMVVSYWFLGDDIKAQYYLDELRELQTLHLNSNGLGVVSAPSDGLTTGFNWEYFPRLHIGATAWHILAEQKHNPFWPNAQRLTDVDIMGASNVIRDTDVVLTAIITPTTATMPISYTWSPVPSSGQGTYIATYNWSTLGTQVITVTVQNMWGAVIETHTVTVRPEVQAPLELNPPNLDFGSVPVNTSTDQFINVCNPETVDAILTVRWFEFPNQGPFSLYKTRYTLEPDECRNVYVNFWPTSATFYDCTLLQFKLRTTNNNRYNAQAEICGGTIPSYTGYHVADFNGDGLDDYLTYDEGIGWVVFESTGSSFTPALWSTAAEREAWIGDFNGDGLDDLLGYDEGIGWVVFESTGSSFTPVTWSTAVERNVWIGDFNGDGLDDFLGYDEGVGWVVFESTGFSFTPVTWSTAAERDVWIGDFTGDGLDDFLGYDGGVGWVVFESTGSSFTTTTWSTAAERDVWIGDFNGDSLDDFLGYDPGVGWVVFESTGANFISETWSTLAEQSVWVGDFNGDGLDDFLSYDTITEDWIVFLTDLMFRDSIWVGE